VTKSRRMRCRGGIYHALTRSGGGGGKREETT
jgi:hypothetical protein